MSAKIKQIHDLLNLMALHFEKFQTEERLAVYCKYLEEFSIEKIKQREQSERKRYKELYNVDYYDQKLYNLIIDTTDLSINEVIEKITKVVK